MAGVLTSWSCPHCPWTQSAHPTYGWSSVDDRAVEVHRDILCKAGGAP